MVTIDQIKELREQTLAPMQECRKALEEAQGDLAKAKEILRKWGKALAEKKVEREAKDGIVETYIHPNKKLGVMLELRCESDFVARNEEFQTLAHELCLQIAAANPLFTSENDIPADVLEKEKQLYLEQFTEQGKPKQVVEGIVEGKLKKYKEEKCLLSQPWIKDDSKKVQDLITQAVAKLGENIVVRKFSRFAIS